MNPRRRSSPLPNQESLKESKTQKSLPKERTQTRNSEKKDKANSPELATSSEEEDVGGCTFRSKRPKKTEETSAPPDSSTFKKPVPHEKYNTPIVTAIRMTPSLTQTAPGINLTPMRDNQPPILYSTYTPTPTLTTPLQSALQPEMSLDMSYPGAQPYFLKAEGNHALGYLIPAAPLPAQPPYSHQNPPWTQAQGYFNYQGPIQNIDELEFWSKKYQEDKAAKKLKKKQMKKQNPTL